MPTEIQPEILQLGAVAILFLFAIREFFNWLKNRKENGVLQELKSINTNHLNAIQQAVQEGNDRVVKAISDMNADLKEILGRIDGRLS